MSKLCYQRMCTKQNLRICAIESFKISAHSELLANQSKELPNAARLVAAPDIGAVLETGATAGAAGARVVGTVIAGVGTLISKGCGTAGAGALCFGGRAAQPAAFSSRKRSSCPVSKDHQRSSQADCGLQSP